jgi:REP element-mobilizing transposase RayT
MDKFQNKYRIPSARLQQWDYGWNGAYFLTICTKKRECFFGNIICGEMKLSEIGELAKKYLLEIPERYDYALLDEFAVMPNHIHAIVIIDKMDDGRNNGNNDGGGDCRDAINRVSTLATTLESPTDRVTGGGITGNNNPMLHHNISRIMNWYTGRVTFESRKINPNYGWQARFHDHIIRDDSEYQRVKAYIRNNPQNWENDTLNNPN